MPAVETSVVLLGGAALLGALCIVLFVVAFKRLARGQEELVESMLERYDDRLAEFAQTLNDALNQTLPARITAAISGALAVEAAPPASEVADHSNVMRLLELARARTEADAAIAVVDNGKSEPLLATVGLSDAEAARVGRLGTPDYRGARAIQVSFPGEASAGRDPIRSGLAIPILDSPSDQGMLAVLTRKSERRFSEVDITTLEDVLSFTRPALETSLELREPDPVPERDPLTTLYDRPSFHALLDREIARARARQLPLALLSLDVDRLTTLNARIGQLAADEILAKIAGLLDDVVGSSDLACRVGGGRFAVIVAGGDSRVAEQHFERFRAMLHERPLPNLGVVTVSGGVAELLPADDVAALIVRADAALGLAKNSGRDTVVTAARRVAA